MIRRLTGAALLGLIAFVGLTYGAAEVTVDAELTEASFAPTLEGLQRQLQNDVYPDGVHAELAVDATVSLLERCVQVVDWARAHDKDKEISEPFLATVENMFDYLCYASMPNGLVPGLNDSPSIEVLSLLKQGAKLFPQREDFLYVATQGKQGTTPAKHSRAFPYAGQYVMRSGWAGEDNYLLFDAGPYGTAGQHEDKLSFCLYGVGQEQIIDAGEHPQGNAREQAYTQATLGHNTILVDKQGQCRSGQKETWRLEPPFRPAVNPWQSTSRFDFVVGRYDRGFGPEGKIKVTHTRAVLFIKPDLWIIADTLEPTDRKPHRYESLFHLNGPQATMDETSYAVKVPGTQGDFYLLPVTGQATQGRLVQGQTDPSIQGWASEPWREVPTAIYQTDAAGPLTMITILAPTRSGQAPPRIDDLPVRHDRGAAAVDIRSTNRRWLFLARRQGGTIARFGDILTDGRWVLVELDDQGQIKHRFIYDGLLIQKQQPETQPATTTAPSTSPSAE